MADLTNLTYDLYSPDHPKFGANAKKAAAELQKPEPVFQKPSGEDGDDSNWASELSTTFQARQGNQQQSSLPQESKEFIARRALRQDSSATLVDFGRRLSQADNSKIQLQVRPNAPSVSPKIGHSPGGTFGDFKWRPSLTPLQADGEATRDQRFGSDATLVDPASWRRGSRQGSSASDMWKARQGSDTTISPIQRRGSRARSRQGSQMWMPTLSDVPFSAADEPELAELEKAMIAKTINIPSPPRVERDPLKGLRQPTIEDDNEDDSVAVPEVQVVPAEPVVEISSTHFSPEPALMDPFVDRMYPVIADPVDPARQLSRYDLIHQRLVFSGGILSVNAALLIVALAGPAYSSGLWVLAFICFIKAKDCLASIIACVTIISGAIYRTIRPLPPVESKWILSLIPAYSESEEQIVKTVFSLRDNEVAPHRQVMCIMLDGNSRNVKQHMRITRSFRRNYVTSKFKRNELIINAGFMEDVPVICFEKVKNAGKKDSLILCHDLFNTMRDNAPLYTKLLREDVWEDVLPELVGKDFPGFDMVFCTDADSTIHKGAIRDLANSIARDPKAIASCGLVLVELEPGAEWSFWNLYQQFQVCCMPHDIDLHC